MKLIDILHKKYITIPKGASNGDVMLLLFPDARIVDGNNFVSFWYTKNEDGRYVNFRKPWWDAKYNNSLDNELTIVKK